MTETTARRWAYAAAAAGVIANGALAARAPWQPAIRSAPGPGGLAGQLIAATILGCGALMLAGFARNVSVAVWSATAVGVIAWLAIPRLGPGPGPDPGPVAPVLPVTETAAVPGRRREARS